MRGLLYIVLLGGAVLVLLTYVVLPAASAGFLTAAIGAAGLEAPDTVVRVRSDPPWDLLGLHADQVQVRATHATFRGASVDSVALDFTDVAILGGSTGGVVGRLDGVSLPDVGLRKLQGLRLATVDLSGSGGSMIATSTVTAADARTLIANGIQAVLGVFPTTVTLTAPDRVVVRIAGAEASGRVSVTADGGLVVHLDTGPMARQDLALAGADSTPFRLTSVTVTADGGLRIVGELPGGLLG